MNDIDKPEPTAVQPPKSIFQRSVAEWITLAITTAILLMLVGLIVYDWRVNQNSPPAFAITVADPVRIGDGGYYVPFTIINTGGHIARTVQVSAQLHIDNETDETGEQQFDFLSGHEQKQGNFVFIHDPLEGELLIRVASYGVP